MTNLEIIRNACIKANPEIMELKFGCRVELPKYKNQLMIHTIYAVEENYYSACMIFKKEWVDIDIGKDRIKNFTIIGREIRLADVLLAIRADWNYRAYNNKNLDKYIDKGLGGTEFEVVQKWDLKNDFLELQSQETIDFIAGLLGGE